jgi:ParB family chromosome partitioning protein
VKQYINSGKLTAGHARALVGMPESQSEAMAREIVERGLNVREVETLTQQRHDAGGAPKKPRQRAAKDVNTVALEKRLSDALGLLVTIDHRGEGGVVAIKYRGLDQLDDVIRRLEKD